MRMSNNPPNLLLSPRLGEVVLWKKNSKPIYIQYLPCAQASVERIVCSCQKTRRADFFIIIFLAWCEMCEINKENNPEKKESMTLIVMWSRMQQCGRDSCKDLLSL